MTLLCFRTTPTFAHAPRPSFVTHPSSMHAPPPPPHTSPPRSFSSPAPSLLGSSSGWSMEIVTTHTRGDLARVDLFSRLSNSARLHVQIWRQHVRIQQGRMDSATACQDTNVWLPYLHKRVACLCKLSYVVVGDITKRK
jgi:hypothetical protein